MTNNRPLWDDSNLVQMDAIVVAIDTAIMENVGDNVIAVDFPDGRQMQFHTLESLRNLRAELVNNLNLIRAEKIGVDWVFGRSVQFRP